MYDVFKDMLLVIYHIHNLSYTQLRDAKINEAVELILQDQSNEIILDEEEWEIFEEGWMTQTLPPDLVTSSIDLHAPDLLDLVSWINQDEFLN